MIEDHRVIRSTSKRQAVPLQGDRVHLQRFWEVPRTIIIGKRDERTMFVADTENVAVR